MVIVAPQSAGRRRGGIRDPGPVESVGDCRRLARDLEDRCAEIYADAVARSVDDDREVATRALTACALRAVAWGARPEPFPGVSEF